MVTSLGQQQFFFANSCATQDVIWEDTRPAWIAWSYTCVMCWKCGFCIAARSFMGAWRDQWCFWTYHGKGAWVALTHSIYFMHACPPACRCIEEQWPPNSCLTLCCLFMHDLCTASWCPTCMACTIFWTPLHVPCMCDRLNLADFWLTCWAKTALGFLIWPFLNRQLSSRQHGPTTQS